MVKLRLTLLKCQSFSTIFEQENSALLNSISDRRYMVSNLKWVTIRNNKIVTNLKI